MGGEAYLVNSQYDPMGFDWVYFVGGCGGGCGGWFVVVGEVGDGHSARAREGERVYLH